MIGNPAHDLIRLAHSLATAARGSDLPGVTLVKMLEEMVEGYEHGLVSPGRAASVADRDDLAPVRSVLNQSRRRGWSHLAEERIEDVKPEIPLGERYWVLSKEERADITALFEDEAVVAKVLQLKDKKQGTLPKIARRRPIG